MNTVAIVQARMGASRLPNKMMLSLHGYPIIEWVYHRVMQVKQVDLVVFALPDTKQDDLLAFYLQSIGATVFRGSENDLVERYYKAAKSVDADTVIRICADNPLICASEVDRLISSFNENECDYAYNHIPIGNSYPDGIGAEICTMDILEEIYLKAILQNHREHLFNYIIENKENFKIKTFDPPESIMYPEVKLDIDTIDDYRKLLEKEYRIDMTAEEIILLATQ